MNKVSKEVFKKRLLQIQISKEPIYSHLEHREYTNIRAIGGYVKGKREGGGEFEIKIDGLYRAYLDDVTTTSALRDYVEYYYRSPALAILDIMRELDRKEEEGE